MPPQGSDDETANQAACSRAPIAVAYRTGRPSREPASIAGIFILINLTRLAVIISLVTPGRELIWLGSRSMT